MAALATCSALSFGAHLAAPQRSSLVKKRSANRALHRTAAASATTTAAASSDEVVQLGTAKLPANVDEEVFVTAMFQWANTLTTSGQNMPLALPLRVDPQPNGFSLAFLMSDPKGEPGTFVSVGEIVASVEDAPGGDARVLMVRGTGKAAQRDSLVDLPVVMQTMPGAIKNAIIASTKGL